MDLISFFTRFADFDEASGRSLAAEWSTTKVAKGQQIVRQSEAAPDEFIVLEGQLAALITDADGKSICVGMYRAHAVVTPQIARVREDRSLVTLEVVKDGAVARMPSARLTTLMVADPIVRDWANGILRAELAMKADREWCLAALSGADRLAWFRERFPRNESEFNHGLIASYLGMTPVSLSRLRRKNPAITKDSGGES